LLALDRFMRDGLVRAEATRFVPTHLSTSAFNRLYAAAAALMCLREKARSRIPDAEKRMALPERPHAWQEGSGTTGISDTLPGRHLRLIQCQKLLIVVGPDHLLGACRTAIMEIGRMLPQGMQRRRAALPGCAAVSMARRAIWFRFACDCKRKMQG